MKWVITIVLCWTILVDRPLSVHDGDTFTIDARVWHGMTIRERVRVLDIDTPELTGADKERGRLAQAFTERWLLQGPFSVYTCRRDAFGRLLGVVSRPDSVLAADLKEAGHTK